MHSLIRRILRHPSAPGLHRALRAQGATRELVRFTEPFRANILGAWLACPRGTWALELAARGGVQKGILRAAVDALDRASRTPGGLFRPEPRSEARQGRPRPETNEYALHCAASYGSGAVSLEEFLLSTEGMMHAMIDAEPTVRCALEAVHEAQRWGRHQAMLEASDRYDRTHAETHHVLARIVRRAIPAPRVRAAWSGGSRGHPYR